MKKIGLILFMFLLAPAVFAADSKNSEPSVLAGIGHLEKRGLANIFLFPAEWPLIAKQEHYNYPKAFVVTLIPTTLTHLGGRLFSGIADVVFLPLAYPFSRYDDSLPVAFGWGEYPWQQGVN